MSFSIYIYRCQIDYSPRNSRTRSARTTDLAKAIQSAVRSTSDIPRKSKSVRVSQATV
jgi:hypothetical protein